jgi:plasmid replication initiation protein
MDKNYIVTKSNVLINCSYDLTVQQQKIILTLASMVQPQDIEFKEYEFKIKDFIELLGVKDGKKYTEIPKITEGLMKPFKILDDGDLIQIGWLSSARHKKKQGIIILRFDPTLKPYMLGLKEFYTSYRLENVLSLKSKYSIRIYEVLKSNLFKKNITIEIEELRKMVGANEKTYDTYGNLKSKILLQAQKELKDKTDITFEFEEIKTGRKVSSIKFNISSNKNTSKNEIAATLVDDPKDMDIIKQVQEIFHKHKITKNEASCILKDAKNKIDLIEQCYSYSLTKDVPNIVGYMRTLVKGFNKPQSNSKTGGFNDYEQRKYDFDDLEKKLLGWGSNQADTEEEYEQESISI